ncbi:hypothetical protein EON64_11725, partial [archaeon]
MSASKPPSLNIPPPANQEAYQGSCHEKDGEKESQIQSPSLLDASNKGNKRKSRITQASHSAVCIPSEIQQVTFASSNGNQGQSEVISDEDFTSGLIYTEINYSVAHGSALLGAIKRGDKSEMESIVTEHFHSKVHSVHDVRGLFNSSPLIVAAQYGRKDILLLLLSPPSPSSTA